MRLPPPSAHYSQCVRYGRYLARRLRRAKLATLAADVEKATLAVRTNGRALEDADDAIQEAIADRDGSDDDLDGAAQTARAKLAGRSADADRKAPYTLIFHEGLAYYTAAPLDEEVKRYGELKVRLEEHLPANDKVRTTTVAAIDAGIAAFSKATAALAKARTDDSLASTRLTTSRESWEKQVEKTYGALVQEMGRSAAERFFPQIRGKSKAQDAPPAPDPADPSKPD
jgi:hypothetical protein